MGVHGCALHTRSARLGRGLLRRTLQVWLIELGPGCPHTLQVLWTAPESQPDMSGMGHS